MKKMTIEAKREKLPEVLGFLDEVLESMDCGMKQQMQLDIAVEEIFVNIASYAYADQDGIADIEIDDGTPGVVSIRFTDGGIPYDPVAKPDPDTTLSADERQIGGLGIYMVKKSMDEMLYERSGDKNILTIKKKF